MHPTSTATRPEPAVSPVAARSSSIELARVLDRAAHRVAELGTASERRLIEAMSTVAAQSAPGAAAALVDRDGTEIARLRAFGLVHAHVLRVLGPLEHARVLDALERGRRAPAAPRPRPVPGCST